MTLLLCRLLLPLFVHLEVGTILGPEVEGLDYYIFIFDHSMLSPFTPSPIPYTCAPHLTAPDILSSMLLLNLTYDFRITLIVR